MNGNRQDGRYLHGDDIEGDWNLSEQRADKSVRLY